MEHCDCLSSSQGEDFRTSILGDISSLDGTAGDRADVFRLFCHIGLSTIDPQGDPIPIPSVQMPTAKNLGLTEFAYLKALDHLHSLGLVIGSQAAGYRPHYYMPWYGMFWRIAAGERFPQYGVRYTSTPHF